MSTAAAQEPTDAQPDADEPPEKVSLRGMGLSQYVTLARVMVVMIKRDDLPTLAAAVAFKIFLALFPALFAAVLIATILADGAAVVRFISQLQVLPEPVLAELGGPLEELIAQAGGTERTAALVGIGVGLWAATGAAVTLQKSLTRIHGGVETRGLLTQRLTALLVVGALVTGLTVYAVVLVVGGVVQGTVLDWLIPPDEPLRAWVGLLVTLARYALSIVVLVVVLAFVFWVGPDRPQRPRLQWFTPGALLGIVGWVLASGLFALYLQFAGLNPVYGAIGGVIVPMLWLQLSMIVVLLGAELNAELRRTRNGTIPLEEVLAVFSAQGREVPAEEAARLAADRVGGDRAATGGDRAATDRAED